MGIVVSLLAVLAAAFAPAAAAKSSKPVVYKPRWHLVTRSPFAVDTVATDRYVVIQYSGRRLLLIDEQTGRRMRLSFPACETSPGFGPVFGGPWLAIGCSLYNLNSRQWTSFRISSQCLGGCSVVGVGRDWAKIVSDEGQIQYGPADYYLQNIRTGQFERDPAIPGGKVFDDLNAPSGSRSLCAPLSYPSVFVRGTLGPYLGGIGFHGQFALTLGQQPGGSDVYRLRRCGSNLNLLVWDTANNGSPSARGDVVPVASSRAMVLSSDGVTLHGWLLASLRRFTIRSNLDDYITPVAVTDRTIYVATQSTGQLWAAPLPTPKQKSRHR